MQIGNKLFPYPTLNKVKEYSCYRETNYVLKCEDYNDGKNYVFKDTYIEIDNSQIKDMIINGILGVALVIECSQTIFRKTFEITLEPQTYSIEIGNLKGMVYVSCYIYAKQDIKSFLNNDLLEEYEGYGFDIEKNDIVAIDDGFKIKIEYDKDIDKKVSSIFQIIRNSNVETMTIQNKIDKIVISIPDDEFECYSGLRANDHCQNIFFSIFAIPALTLCLKEFQDKLKDEKIDFEDIEFNYNWFNSVKNAYLKQFGKELNSETFLNASVETIAQQLLNNGCLEGIKDLFGIVIRSQLGGDEVDE